MVKRQGAGHPGMSSSRVTLIAIVIVHSTIDVSDIKALPNFTATFKTVTCDLSPCYPSPVLPQMIPEAMDSLKGRSGGNVWTMAGHELRDPIDYSHL